MRSRLCLTAHAAVPALLMLQLARLSIIVSTYDRFEHLLAFLDHYGNGHLPHLDAIFIAWVGRPLLGGSARVCE